MPVDLPTLTFERNITGYRVRDIDTVCFLDADAELLAPRYRAAEQFSALVVRAARLVGSRERGGVVMVQTHVPDHPVVHALKFGELHRLWPDELARRRLFRLPPFGARTAASTRFTSSSRNGQFGVVTWSAISRRPTTAPRCTRRRRSYSAPGNIVSCK